MNLTGVKKVAKVAKDPVKKALGQRLANILIEKGMSIPELADELNLNRNTVNHWINGDHWFDYKRRRRIANILNIDEKILNIDLYKLNEGESMVQTVVHNSNIQHNVTHIGDSNNSVESSIEPYIDIIKTLAKNNKFKQVSLGDFFNFLCSEEKLGGEL